MIAEIARFARKVLIRVIISRMKYYKQVLAIESLQPVLLACVNNKILINMIGVFTIVINDVMNPDGQTDK